MKKSTEALKHKQAIERNLLALLMEDWTHTRKRQDILHDNSSLTDDYIHHTTGLDVPLDDDHASDFYVGACEDLLNIEARIREILERIANLEMGADF